MIRRAISKPTRSWDSVQLLLSAFRSAGFEGLQLKMSQYLPFADSPDELLRVAGGDVAAVSALILMGGLDDAGAEQLLSIVRLAATLGSERVVFCHQYPRDRVCSGDLTSFARTLSAVGDQARMSGVALSLHPHVGHPVMLPRDIRAFFADVEPGTVGLTVDTGHLAMGGTTDLAQVVREFSAVIDNVHLKDLDETGWRIPGQGRLELGSVIEALRDTGYNGWLCVDEESDADLETGLRQSRDWLDRHLPAAIG